MNQQGFDVSNWQGQLPESGIIADFVYVQVSDGTGFKNPDAVQQVAALKAQGVRVGYYHFFRPDESMQDQLLNFYSYASALGESQLPVMVDCEVESVNGWAYTASQLADFCQHVEGWTNVVPNPRSFIYVNRNFYDNLQGEGFPWGRWVWLADPGTSPSRSCIMWQHAPAPQSWLGGRAVDPDTFLGDEGDWQEFLNLEAIQQAPAPPQQIVQEAPTSEESEVTSKELTLTALDNNGNGYYSAEALGISSTNLIVNVVWINTDPAKSGYGHVPSNWSVDSDGQLVVEGGAPGGEYGCILWVAQ